MATTNNAHSDLVHLFVDGEATETERNTLFGALKDSPELQEELTSAMQLKQAFAADISRLQPPSYLESQIAERAGLIVAASASLATAPAVVNTVTTAMSNVAPIAATGISKGLLAVVIGTSVGVLTTIGLIKYSASNNAPIATAPATVSQSAAPRNVQAPSFVAPQSLDAMKAPEATFVKNSANASSKVPTLHSAANLVDVNSTKASLNKNSNVNAIPTKSVKAENRSVNDASVASTIPIAVNNNSAVVEKKENLETAMPPIFATQPQIPTLETKYGIGGNRDVLHTADLYDGSLTSLGRMSARIAGIMTSKLYQGGNTPSPAGLNNFAVGLKYDLDALNSFGLDAGHETFPIYLSNGKGGFDNYSSITWYGASWTYTAVYLDLPLGIRPEARLLAAESNAGPIVKYSGGLVFPVFGGISLSTDVEETMLFIKSNGANVTGNKLALTAALSIHFW